MSESSANTKKLQVHLSFDGADRMAYWHFDRAPDSFNERLFLNAIKDAGHEYMGKMRAWKGDAAKVADMLEEPTFRYRLKHAADGFTCVKEDGESVDLCDWIAHVRAYDPNAALANVDFSSMPKATFNPATEKAGNKKRKFQ